MVRRLVACQKCKRSFEGVVAYAVCDVHRLVHQHSLPLSGPPTTRGNGPGGLAIDGVARAADAVLLDPDTVLMDPAGIGEKRAAAIFLRRCSRACQVRYSLR